MKLAACVILYNPTPGMVVNIESYFQEVSDLFIIDNSSTENLEFKTYFAGKPNVQYISLAGNKGIAFALNYAGKLAVGKGYDWLLTMDQDSRFLSNKFFKLVDDESDDSIAIYAASYTLDVDRSLKPYSSNFNEIHFTITSGNIVNLKQWKSVGGFEEKLFIDEVDHDYCIKARLNGGRVLTSKEIFLSHAVGVGITADKRSKLYNASRPEPLRTYYITRNVMYVIRKYVRKDPKFALNRAIVLAKSVGRIIFLYPHKRKYFSYFLRGVIDNIKSRYGPLQQ
jgi:rhamnosyltransferase